VLAGVVFDLMLVNLFDVTFAAWLPIPSLGSWLSPYGADPRLQGTFSCNVKSFFHYFFELSVLASVLISHTMQNLRSL